MIRIIKRDRTSLTYLNKPYVSNHLHTAIILSGAIPYKNYYKGQYRDPLTNQKRNETTEALASDSNNKCAYCETIVHKPQVEHFRPHGQGNAYTAPNTAVYAGHSGYSWLCYEWDNFLPSCWACNGKKSSYFPIAGIFANIRRANNGIFKTRLVLSHVIYANEQKLLLNPAEDNLDGHFTFNLLGRILPQTLRAEISEDLYGLNRDDLILKRQAIGVGIKSDLQFQIDITRNFAMPYNILKEQFKYILGKLAAHFAPEKEYTAYALYIKDNFDTLIKNDLQRLTVPITSVLEAAVNEVFV